MECSNQPSVARRSPQPAPTAPSTPSSPTRRQLPYQTLPARIHSVHHVHPVTQRRHYQSRTSRHFFRRFPILERLVVVRTLLSQEGRHDNCRNNSCCLIPTRQRTMRMHHESMQPSCCRIQVLEEGRTWGLASSPSDRKRTGQSRQSHRSVP